MQLAIVEDLDSDFNLLAERIRENCFINRESVEISRFQNAEEFLTNFRPGVYQAIFFDIILGGQTGIDAAWKVREADTRLPIIFITTETGFSLESYGIHALDYLIKPVSARALGWCMERLRETMAAPSFIEVREIGKSSGAASRLIFLDELVFAESIRNGILIHTLEGEVQTRLKMSELCNLFPKTSRFYECGRGLVVNFSHVTQISESGEVLLSNGQKIYCSRRRVKDTIEAFASWRSEKLRKGTLYR